MSVTQNLLVKSIVIGLISGGMLAVAPPAAPASPAPRASAAQPHRCTPAEPSFTSLTASSTVSCREARALNSYMTNHETLAGRFVLNGETWLGTVYSRANNQTDMVYRDGTQTVWITYGGAAS
jgi:hypothetical protein